MTKRNRDVILNVRGQKGQRETQSEKALVKRVHEPQECTLKIKQRNKQARKKMGNRWIWFMIMFNEDRRFFWELLSKSKGSLDNDVNTDYGQWNIVIESLILAQDERWRRA